MSDYIKWERGKRAKIIETLSDYDPYVVISALFLEHVYTEAYTEASHTPSAEIEYLVSMLLSRRNSPVQFSDTDLVNLSRRVGESINLAEEVHISSRREQMDKVQDESDLWKKLKLAANAHYQSCRWPAYQSVAKEIYLSLYGGIEKEMAFVFGFTPKEAVCIIDSINSIFDKRNAAHKLNSLCSSGSYASEGIVMISSITERQVITESNLAATTVRKFLKLLAIKETEQVKEHTDNFNGEYAIRSMPLVSFEYSGETYYLVTSQDNLLWALMRKAEEVLLNIDSISINTPYDNYTRHESFQLEKETEKLLSSIFPQAKVWTNVRYFQNDIEVGEIDVLLHYDNLWILCEVKSGKIEVNNLQKSLKQNVGKAVEQLLRLQNAIANQEEIRYYELINGIKVELDIPIEANSRLEPMIVTLSDIFSLDGHISILKEALVESQSMSAENELPFFISIWDLYELVQLIQYPSEFSLYLKQKRLVAPRLIDLNDELDIFICSLKYNLQFEDQSSPIRIAPVFTESLDDYRELNKGELPRQKLEEKCKRSLDKIFSENPDGALEEGEKLLLKNALTRKPQFISEKGVTIVLPTGNIWRPRKSSFHDTQVVNDNNLKVGELSKDISR